MMSAMDLVEASVLGVAVVLVIAYFLDQRRSVKLNLDRSAHAAALKSRKSATADEPAATDSPANGPKLTILFGTQSGTAESFAEGFCKEARARGYVPNVFDLESYDYRQAMDQEQCLVIFIATHGEGDPPDSAAEFYSWLMSDDRERELLSKVTFAVFGLGNRQYEHFNKCGITVDKRLSYLGGTRLIGLGLGDDSCCIEEDNENWRANLWVKLNEHFGIDSGPSAESQVIVYEPSFRVVFSKELTNPDVSFRNRRSSTSSLSTHRIVNVLSVTQLLKKPTDMSSTVHIVLDLRDRSLPYGTAHNLGVHPRNDYKVVAKLGHRLGYDLDAIFTMKRLKFGNNKKFPVPSPCSVRDALLWHMDVMSPPRKSFFGFLAQYARDPAEKARLMNMSLPAGKQDYNEHIVVDKKTIPEVLDMFPSVTLPLEHFLEECPPLQPRMFTITSSALTHPDQVHLTVALTRTSKARDRIHDGVCSTFLTKLNPGKDTCHVFLRKSSFYLPENFATPVIMCGTGTGIAPFRAFIQEGVHRYKTHGGELPEWHLFFGCRNRDDDFLYEEELTEAHRVGVLTGLHLAFSREDPNKKVYIQHRMKERHELIWNLVDKKNAIIFICGSTDMGKDIRSLLRDIVMTNTGCDADGAGLYLKRLSEDDRLVSELWG